MKYYKLTNQKIQTYKEFQWKLNKWKKAVGGLDEPLCTDSWLHCYDSPLLAVLHNPIHAHISNPRLFEVEVRGEMKNNNGLKLGFREMRLIKEIEVLSITRNQQIAYAILCAQKVYKEATWNAWARNWLNGVDRSTDTANAAYTVYAAAYAANNAAYAANAAAYAANAANAAAYAADAAYAANAANNVKTKTIEYGVKILN